MAGTPGRHGTHINLDKSIQLLGEAVGSPGHVLRSARKTPGLFKADAFRSRGEDAMQSLNFSAPSDSMMATFGSSVMPGLGDSTMNSSVNQLGVSKVPENITTTNVGLILDEEPNLAACSALYGEFLEAWQMNSSEHQIFQLLDKYDEMCTEQFTILKNLITKTTRGNYQNRYSEVVNVMGRLDKERHTWRLVSSLYKDRLETEVRGGEEAMLIDQLSKYQSEKDIMVALFERDTAVRQGQVILDWLEKAAFEKLDDLYEKVEFFTDKAGQWENTQYILEKKGNRVYHSERPIVDQMDPDAPIRQQRPLADLDRDDEQRLLQIIFAYIRAGHLKEAQDLCIKCGQAWRAATLEGWRLYHDPNYNSLGPGGEVIGVEGNPYRDVWKNVCWAMAESEDFSVYERAMYATYSGNLKHLLPVCQSWDDYLWAHFRVLVDTRVEQEIRMNVNRERPLESPPTNYFDKMFTMESIFSEIEACPYEEVRTGGGDYFHVIQKYIILGDIDGLLEEIQEWLMNGSRHVTPHFLRFLAHLVLFFRTVGVGTKEELSLCVLEAYVHSLIDSQNKDLIAMYTATLPQDRQLEWYARFLEGVHGTDERKRCLELAEEAGLDIPNITKLVVEKIRSHDSAEFSMATEAQLDAAVSEEDRQKIEAIEWLVFDQAQRAEAIRQANAVMRGFLALRKHQAASAVFSKIPTDSIDVIFKTWKMRTGSEDLPEEDQNAIHEYLCIKAYLDAQDSFSDWFQHYHHAKPSEPSCRPGANFTERVAFEHQQNQYEAELRRWQHTLNMQTKITAERLYNVLLFPDGGWMIDQHSESSPDDSRAQQMASLRKLCLPAICYLLCTILSETEQHKECLQLADIIASEERRLYQAFNKEELQKLLQKLSQSSIPMLNNGQDPLGYDLL